MIKMVYVRGVNENGPAHAHAMIVRLSSTVLPAMYTIRIFRQNILTPASANGYVIIKLTSNRQAGGALSN